MPPFSFASFLETGSGLSSLLGVLILSASYCAHFLFRRAPEFFWPQNSTTGPSSISSSGSQRCSGGLQLQSTQQRLNKDGKLLEGGAVPLLFKRGLTLVLEPLHCLLLRARRAVQQASLAVSCLPGQARYSREGWGEYLVSQNWKVFKLKFILHYEKIKLIISVN